jgi:hypothetical protein
VPTRCCTSSCTCPARAPGEKYVGDDDWRLVSAQQAPQMADAYAAIAWTLGGAAPGAEK